MSSARPAVYTIPPHRAFADALAAGLIARFGGDKTRLAQGLILIPSNRAGRAITDAFVRRSGGGLLLPRLIPVGDAELEERIGGALEPLEESAEIPPAIEPTERLFLLARVIEQHMPGEIDAAEALRLAEQLARTLDQLLVEEVQPVRLREFAADLPDLSAHWQKSLDRLGIILREWPALLKQRGRIDLSERRNRLLAAMSKRWSERPPNGFVVAAGITTSAPAIAHLLRTVTRLPDGMVILPALDTSLPDAEWQALGPHDPDPVTGHRRRSIETHPQFHLKLLLDRMGVSRSEVDRWRWGGGRDAPAVRSRAIANAMTPAAFSSKWQGLKPVERRLSGVRAIDFADPAEEAQAVAVALREAVEEPGRTAALVTPDRNLARRVSAHLKRWDIEADDSAGRPLSQTPPGGFLLALAAAASEKFAPVSLLAALKHPLAMRGGLRLDWLEGARALDLALRGPRPPAGLAGVTAYLADRTGRDRHIRARAGDWWHYVEPLLRPLEIAFSEPLPTVAGLMAALRETASELSGDEVWAGTAGREAAELFTLAEPASVDGPTRVLPTSLPQILEQLMSAVAIRPPYGQHPRIFIWGLLEARLQHADLMILSGLNEGTWPALPTPDPWLAPRIRHELGLPGLERRIGLSAHDLASALGGRQVLVTRARRDARAPAVASRFWLRLEAMTGGLTRASNYKRWAQALDRPEGHRPAAQPAPNPPVALRPINISVTEVDRLKADPFAFYARKMLRLSPLDVIDADPSPAWRGTAVHQVLEDWMKHDDCDPSRLRGRAEELLRASSAHPLIRALWQPRLLEAIDWIAEEVRKNKEVGRLPLKAEVWGELELAGVTLQGKADRIDRAADGSIVILDYKTGSPPGSKAVAEGYSMQLGLLGLMAEHGGFADVAGVPTGFEYWSLSKKGGKIGYVSSPVGGRNGIEPGEFTTMAARNFIAAAQTWLTGPEPFTAKLHPEYAPYAEYDQLMRLDEWYGREQR